MNIKPIILISGEPKSIFFEIFFKAIKKKKYKSPLILICCKKLLQRYMKKNNINKQIKLIRTNEINNLAVYNNNLNVIDVPLKKSFNEKSRKLNTKKYIKSLFDLSFYILKKKITNKFVNGPINKKTFLEKKFYGVTEYISNYFKKEVGMLLYNKNLSVCPLTTHLPLKLVSRNITKKLITQKVELIDFFYRKNFNFKPKIGLTGINPHCESVLKINEDEKIISPLVNKLKKNGIKIKGPYSADTIFMKQNREKYDVIVGIYHDQVIGPFKTLFEYDAINVTMGLPFLRVSPDHGPNIKMFEKNKSNPKSLIRCLEFLDKR